MPTRDPQHLDFAGLVTSRGPLREAPTRSQVIRAKDQAVGGKKDRCLKGKSCSATCIAFNKFCLVEFPIPIQRELRRMSIAINRQGNITEGSLSDRAAGAGMLQLGKVFKKGEGPAEVSGKGKNKIRRANVKFEDPSRAQRRLTTLEENRELKKRIDLLGNAEVSEQAMRLLQKDAFGRGLRLRENELRAIYDALPKSMQKSLDASGKPPPGKAWGGKDENGNEVFAQGPNKARGLAVLDMWFRQGGTDAYMGRGGKILPPTSFDVEHVKPTSKGGADAPSNWILARSGSQQKRQSAKLRDWINKLPETPAEQQAVLRQARTDARKKRLKNTIIKELDPTKLQDQQIASMAATDLGKMFDLRTAFTSSTQPIKAITQGIQRANSGPPKPVVVGMGLIAKEKGPAAVKDVVGEFRKIWNNDLIRDKSITPTQAMQQISNLLQRSVSSEQFNAFVRPQLESFIKTNSGFGFQPISFEGGAAPRKMNAMDAWLAKYGNNQ